MELHHPVYKRITFNLEICMGKPCIRGSRFMVHTLLGYMAAGLSVDELLATFPFLEKEDILEAIGFAALTTDQQYIPLEVAA